MRCQSSLIDLLIASTRRSGVLISPGGLNRTICVGPNLLKSLGIPTPRSLHYHVLGPSLICLSPQVSLANKYLTSRKYSIEYHFHTVSLQEHQQSSTHNSREHIAAYLSSSLDSSLEFKNTPQDDGNIFPILPACLQSCLL